MADEIRNTKRVVTRNGRVQIVSYEIESPGNSTTSSLQYGEVTIGVPGEGIQNMKFSEESFRLNVDSSISQLNDPNLQSFTVPKPSIELGAVARVFTALAQVTSPAGTGNTTTGNTTFLPPIGLIPQTK